MAWADIPTCKSQGLDIEYLMLRGVFMAPGVPKEAVDYYVEVFKKVRETPEWKQLMNDGAFFEFATALEKIIARDGLATAFRRCTSRAPQPDELAVLKKLTPLNAARALLNLDETVTRE